MRQIQIVKLGDFHFPDIQDALDCLYEQQYCNFTIVSDHIPIPEPNYKISNLIEEYSFKQLQEILTAYRNNKGIFHDVILIGIINRSIEKNYFSFTDSVDKYAVITINDLERLLENITIKEFLISEIVKHTVAIIENHSWHDEPRRCLFDFCGDKRDIIPSMAYGALCGSCNSILSQEAKYLLQRSFDCTKKYDPINTLSQEIKKMIEEPKREIHTQQYIENRGVINGGSNIYNEAEKQNLIETAAEIQKLLNQIAQTSPKSEAIVVNTIQAEIKRNPTLKSRLINALKSGGIEALKAIFNHPLVSVPVETIKGFLEAEAG